MNTNLPHSPRPKLLILFIVIFLTWLIGLTWMFFQPRADILRKAAPKKHGQVARSALAVGHSPW